MTLAIALLPPLALALHAHSARGFTHTVGVFVVLAELLRDGVFYPHAPSVDLVYSAFYHPLAFAPLALLPGRGVDLLPALRLLVGGELCLCLCRCAALARAHGLRGVDAWQPAVWALCTVPVGFGLLGMRDDPRATLFALLAVALHPLRRGGTELAALALVAAFFTKATAPLAPGLALAVMSWRRGGSGEVARLVAVSALAAAAVIAWLEWGARADFVGNGLYYALVHAPKEPRAWTEAFAALGRDLTWDLSLPLLLGASLAAVVVQCARRRVGVLELLVLGAWMKTLVAYRSVGTELNHLLDLTLYACLQLAVCVGALGAFGGGARGGAVGRSGAGVGAVDAGAVGVGAVGAGAVASAAVGAAAVGAGAMRRRSRLLPFAAPAFLLALAFASWPRPFTTLLPLDNSPSLAVSHVATKAEVLRGYLRQRPLRVLCEEPLIAWEAGAKPLITDPLLTFGTLESWPEIRAAWFTPGDPAALDMLLLMRNPFATEPDPAEWYGPIHFDAAFLDEVRANWQVVATDGQATVLARKGT